MSNETHGKESCISQHVPEIASLHKWQEGVSIGTPNRTADGEIENLTSINLSEQMNQQTSHIYPNQEIHR